VLLALFCLFVIVLMTIRRIPGAIVTGVLGTTFLSFLFKRRARSRPMDRFSSRCASRPAEARPVGNP